jgi:hypothetical protein
MPSKATRQEPARAQETERGVAGRAEGAVGLPLLGRPAEAVGLPLHAPPEEAESSVCGRPPSPPAYPESAFGSPFAAGYGTPSPAAASTPTPRERRAPEPEPDTSSHPARAAAGGPARPTPPPAAEKPTRHGSGRVAAACTAAVALLAALAGWYALTR